MKAASVHGNSSSLRSAAAQLTIARRPCFRTRSNKHNGSNGDSDQTDKLERAQAEERFVSVSDVLAEVCAASRAGRTTSLLDGSIKVKCQ